MDDLRENKNDHSVMCFRTSLWKFKFKFKFKLMNSCLFRRDRLDQDTKACT